MRSSPRRLAVAASVAALLVSGSAIPAGATAGGADTSFGDGGKVRIDLNSTNDQAWKLLQQTDGDLLAVGFSLRPGTSFDFAVARTTANGQLDPSFSGDGTQTIDLAGGDDRAFSGAIQADGKIVLAGRSTTGSGLRMSVIRLNVDGSLDTSFSGDGKLVLGQFESGSTDSGVDVAIQASGRIIVGGTSREGGKSSFAVAGLEPDGDLDLTFGGGDGMVTADPSLSDDEMDELTLDASDRIVAAGSSGNDRFGLMRLDADGDPDPTFGGGDGLVTTLIGANTTGNGVGVQPGTGRIIVTGRFGSFNKDYATAGYETNGDLDPTFGDGDGVVTTSLGSGNDLACALAFAADGSILVGGDSQQGPSGPSRYDFGLVRYTPDGELDTSFGDGGQATTDFGGGDDFTYGVIVQPSGQIVQGGYSGFGGDVDMTLIRYDDVDVPANPDAEIAKAGAAVRGDGIYNLDAHQQSVSGKAKRGSSVTFEAPITNDGTDSDTFTIEAPAGTKKFKTVYRVGGTDVTTAVTGGGYDTGEMASGASLTLVAKVKVTERAAKGNSRSSLVSATSEADEGRGDAVRFTVKAG